MKRRNTTSISIKPFLISAILALLILRPTPAVSQTTGNRILSGFSWITATWDSDVLWLGLNGVKAGEYEISELDNPPRVVIDVPGRTSGGSRPVSASHDFSGGLLVQLRASAGPDGSRIVVESRYPLYWEMPAEQPENGVNISFLLRFKQTVEEIAIDEGTTYYARRYVTPSGQRYVHAVISDPTKSRLRPRVFYASDVTGHQLARVTEMADRSRSAAAINGGFFVWPGTSLSLVIQNGIIKSPPQLHRPAFMVLGDGTYSMDYPPVRARVSSLYGVEWEADSVNQRPAPGHVSLLTPGHPARIHENMPGSKAVFMDNIVEYVTDGEIPDYSERTVLWSRKPFPPLGLLGAGETVEIEYYVDPSWPPILHAIQGGPFLLYSGQVHISTIADDIGNDIARGRSARTGVGFDDSGRIYLVVVEGPDNPRSLGATLQELAATFQDLGATWAMNLDGGSSSAMALSFNQPSGGLPSGSRSVATSLVLIDESGGSHGDEIHF